MGGIRGPPFSQPCGWRRSLVLPSLFGSAPKCFVQFLCDYALFKTVHVMLNHCAELASVSLSASSAFTVLKLLTIYSAIDPELIQGDTIFGKRTVYNFMLISSKTSTAKARRYGYGCRFPG